MVVAAAEPKHGEKESFTIDVVDWIKQDEWERASSTTRGLYLEHCADLLTKRKRLQIRSGIGADGQRLKRRKRPRKDGATGPPLQPHGPKSRSQKWLRASKGKRHVTLWWANGWSYILGAHARGVVRFCPVRDIIGFPEAELTAIRSEARAWWKSNTWPGGLPPRKELAPPKPPPKAPKPPPEPEKEPFTAERLKELTAKVKEPGAKRKIVVEAILRNQSTTTTSIQRHGMKVAEDMHTIEFEGLTFLYPPLQSPTHSDAIVYAIFSTARSDFQIPPNLAMHTKAIILSSGENSNDDHWRKVYKNFTRSAATGGGGDGYVVGYSHEPVSGELLVHEMGHNLAYGVFGDTAPPKHSDFGKAAASGEPVPTTYGQNAIDEDFADSVKLYVSQPWELKRIAPKRFEAIDGMIGSD